VLLPIRREGNVGEVNYTRLIDSPRIIGWLKMMPYSVI
jgi:hypothetical protein